ncbi:MAG: hypothetical protein ACREBU_13370, partial [Nitrososphaera sp.]
PAAVVRIKRTDSLSMALGMWCATNADLFTVPLVQAALNLRHFTKILKPLSSGQSIFMSKRLTLDAN